MRLKLYHFRHHHKKIDNSEQFFNLLSTLNRICLFFGVSPTLDAPESDRHIQRCLHCLWCGIWIVIIHVVNYYSITRIHNPLVDIVKIFFIIELIYNPFIVLLIVYTIYCDADKYRKIPQELLRIYKEYKSFQPIILSDKDLFNVLHKELYSMLGLICMIILFSLIVDFLRTDNGFIPYLIHSSVFSLPNILISLNLGQYWLSLRFIYHLKYGFNELLSARLKRLQWTMNDDHFKRKETTDDDFNFAHTNEFSWYQREFNSSRSLAVSEYEFLESIRVPYFDLDLVRSQVTLTFGRTLFINIIGSVVSLSVEFFAVYKYYEDDDYLGDELSQIYHRFLWIAIHIGRIILILVTNDLIIEEICRTSLILNQIYIRSKEMERAINQFLLRIMTQKQTEMVCGIMELDSLLITGLISAIGNYIIFMIQIDLGNATMADLAKTNITHYKWIIIK
ncbi:putative gustatory receptor 59e [Eurosta solidaginis]|uniref:putative gustatory receptor 59e n=1 Tax=Eurosta solidaginis TaxID=178769 RepID=UPI003530C1A5